MIKVILERGGDKIITYQQCCVVGVRSYNYTVTKVRVPVRVRGGGPTSKGQKISRGMNAFTVSVLVQGHETARIQIATF